MAEELSLKHVTFGNATVSLTEHELIERIKPKLTKHRRFFIEHKMFCVKHKYTLIVGVRSEACRIFQF
jgi:hypothetical protein